MILTIFNQKGGVGKTTTAINLGAGMARAGKSVLLVDMDGSQNLTIGVGLDEMDTKTTTDLLSGESVEPVPVGGYEVIPADINLFSVDLSRPDTLKAALAPIRDRYQYIIIDCPPVLSPASINALVSADQVLIPMQAAYYSARGNVQLLKTIQEVQSRINPQLELCGVLVTMYDSRTKYGREIREETAGYFKDKLFNTFIRRNVKLEEAAGAGEDIFTYDPKSNGAADYQALTEEVLKRV